MRVIEMSDYLRGQYFMSTLESFVLLPVGVSAVRLVSVTAPVSIVSAR